VSYYPLRLILQYLNGLNFELATIPEQLNCEIDALIASLCSSFSSSNSVNIKSTSTNTNTGTLHHRVDLFIYLVHVIITMHSLHHCEVIIAMIRYYGQQSSEDW
jgi:hypothetical protein